ncbi:MAG TPA: glycoside hydrolase domain-containing protein, partial [Arenibacter sp.]|nr:glycoside hydrolase domain-containing protein [Arenibacter sp.]
FFFLILYNTSLLSQEVIQHPVENYGELPNPTPVDPAKWANESAISVGWGSTDVRYKKEEPAILIGNSNTHVLTAWKGERVSAQFVVSNKSGSRDITYTIGEFVNQADKKHRIKTENIFSGFVRYVMTDELNKNGKGSCGHRKTSEFDSTLVADPIDHYAKTIRIMPMSSQGVWIRTSVPSDVKSGSYKGTITVKADGKTIKKLTLQVNVQNQVLPSVEDWKFHLDLWQNPFAVARYYRVEPWSDAHFDALRKEIRPYVDAGGKVITASITHKPWNGQTYDYFETMVTWMKKADGNWAFDYTVFDKWVEFMMSMGVDQQINCYSMIPWRLSFQYFDQATNSLKFEETKPGDEAYGEMWTAMLTSFAAHLKAKGWFDKTFISMDERPMDAMLETLAVIRKADPDYKISLAGALHEELVDELDDYCVALRMKYSDEVVAKRRGEGKITTFYTSCEESYPNTYTFSPPAESEWFAWYAAKVGLDGYLRWALNSWVSDPLRDSRFTTWAGGDTYLIYPGARTSMRFEKMIDGIQSYEKIQLLKQKFIENDNRNALEQLRMALSIFDETKLEKIPAAEMILKARAVVDKLSEM